MLQLATRKRDCVASSFLRLLHRVSKHPAGNAVSLRVVGNAEPAQLCPLLDVRIPLRQIVEFMDIQFINDCGNDASHAVAHHIDDVLSQIISDILAGGISSLHVP